MHFFVINVWSIRILYILFAQNFTCNIICKMKYNITSITDYLEELTGCKTRCLAHEVALGDCYQL